MRKRMVVTEIEEESNICTALKEARKRNRGGRKYTANSGQEKLEWGEIWKNEEKEKNLAYSYPVDQFFPVAHCL
jgi:hypothetical protein